MSYAGTCLTGPMDGLFMLNQTPKFQAVTREPTKITRSANVVPFTQSQDGFWYRHAHGCLWIPASWGDTDAKNFLVEEIGYKALANRYKQLVERRKEDKA